MLAKVPEIRPNDAAAWQRLLTGFWLSGLRLEEAITLTWHDGHVYPQDAILEDLLGSV